MAAQVVDYPAQVVLSQKLRIVLFGEACAGGSGRHLADLACHLASEGHNVHLLYSRTHVDSRFREELSRFKSLGGECKPLSLRHNVHPSDLNAIAQIHQYLYSNGPFDVFHCHSTKAGFLGRIAAFGLKIPTIYTPHAFLTMSPVSDSVSVEGARVIERTLANATDVVICVSEEEVQHAEQLGISKEKLRLVPNGLPLKEGHGSKSLRLATREHLGLRDGDLCIGLVGRLVQQKAPQVAITAFCRAAERTRASMKMVVVGQGPLLARLESIAKSFGVKDKVLFVGARPGLEMMSAFDIYAASSCYEGHPYSFIEALSLSLPIVTTAVGGSKMSVIEGVNGYVIPVGEIGAMADRFVRLASSAALRERMSQASLQMANNFSLERMLRQTEQVYQGLLQERGYLSLAVSVGK